MGYFNYDPLCDVFLFKFSEDTLKNWFSFFIQSLIVEVGTENFFVSSFWQNFLAKFIIFSFDFIVCKFVPFLLLEIFIKLSSKSVYEEISSSISISSSKKLASIMIKNKFNYFN